jgi:hypothetical protein
MQIEKFIGPSLSFFKDMRHILKSILTVSLLIIISFNMFSFIKSVNSISSYEYAAGQFNVYNTLLIKGGLQYNYVINNPIFLIASSILLILSFYFILKYPKLRPSSSNGSSNYVPYLAISMIIIFGIIVAVNFPFVNNQDKFVNFGVLDRIYNINGYFPNLNNTVPINTTLNWYLYLGNNMHEVTKVRIDVKIVDSVELLPNSITGTSSPVSSIWSNYTILEDNQKISRAFNWSINKVSTQGNITYIDEMTINNVTIPLHVSIDTNANPRIVFELYIYNSKEETYSFQWESSGVKRCSWCQVLFTLPPS